MRRRRKEPAPAEAQIVKVQEAESGQPVKVSFYGDDARVMAVFEEASMFLLGGGGHTELWIKLEDGRLLRLEPRHPEDTQVAAAHLRGMPF